MPTRRNSGGRPGGVFNAVTRSGANRYTGSVFEFHRNSALDARNFFDPASLPKPEFTRHQFGGVLGGPLRRDRTFFFGAYEGLVERLGVTGVTAVPDDDARRGIIGGPSNRPASGDATLPGCAVSARQRPLAWQRRRRVSVHGIATHRRAPLPAAHRSPDVGGQQLVRARHARSSRGDSHPARTSRRSPRSTRRRAIPM